MKIAIRATSLATVLITLAACEWGDTIEEHTSWANQLIAGAEYESAIIELKNALQKNNKCAEARWLLGKVYLDSGDVLSAEKELQRAQKLGWAPDDVIPALAESLLAQGKYPEVQELDRKGLGPQAEATLLAIRALAAMSMGESPDGEGSHSCQPRSFSEGQ